MKFCGNCGAQANDDQMFCSYCGASFAENAQAIQQPVAQPVIPDPTAVQPIAQSVIPDPTAAQPANPAQRSMKWFKFLINFALVAGAVLNILYGINYITGGVYFAQSNGTVSADRVYSVYAGMKTVDVVYGLLLLALAAFSIYTRFRLSKFRKNGPMCLCMVYAIGAATTLIYAVSVLAVTGVDSMSQNIVSILVSVAFALGNYKYFYQRKDLFIN